MVPERVKRAREEFQLTMHLSPFGHPQGQVVEASQVNRSAEEENDVPRWSPRLRIESPQRDSCSSSFFLPTLGAVMIGEGRGQKRPRAGNANEDERDCPHTRTFAQTISAARSSCTPGEMASEDGTAGYLSVPTRAMLVDAVRGDTGRRYAFLFHPFILCTWRRRNDFYERADGSNVSGYEASVVVRAYITHAQRHAAQWLFATGGGYRAQHHVEEEERNMNRRRTPSCGYEAEEEDATTTGDASVYHYEEAGTRRVAHPPSLHGDHLAALLDSDTMGMVVNCLLRAVAEEALIVDEQNWIFLYRGRHLMSEQGRGFLRSDVAKRTLPPFEEPHTVALPICLFRTS